MHATIPKGIVGGFEFSVLQRNLKELARKAMEMCFLVLKESNKSRFDSYRRQEQCIDHIPYCLSGLSRALKGEVPTERDTFFRLQECKMIWFSLFKVFERVGKSLISDCERT